MGGVSGHALTRLRSGLSDVGIIASRHPHVTRSLRTAIAAGIAWLIVMPMSGAANAYPYYAPLGAVVAVSTTVAGSLRESVRGVAAIIIGAMLALAVRPLGSAEVVALVIVVGIGSLISGWSRLGSMGSWVPIAAMFVLIPGQSDPKEYLIGYVGLTSLGAAVGVAANLVFAPLPLSRSGAEVRRVRDALARELTALADGLRRDELLTKDEWDERRESLQPLTRQMSEMVAQAGEARRANWRAHLWVETAERQYALAKALEQLALLVEDVFELLRNQEVAGRNQVALGPRLRPLTADLLAATSKMLAEVDGSFVGAEQLREVDDAMVRLVHQIRDVRQDTGDDLFTAGSVVVAVRRALLTLARDDIEEELPSRH